MPGGGARRARAAGLGPGVRHRARRGHTPRTRSRCSGTTPAPSPATAGTPSASHLEPASGAGKDGGRRLVAWKAVMFALTQLGCRRRRQRRYARALRSTRFSGACCKAAPRKSRRRSSSQLRARLGQLRLDVTEPSGHWVASLNVTHWSFGMRKASRPEHVERRQSPTSHLPRWAPCQRRLATLHARTRPTANAPRQDLRRRDAPRGVTHSLR